MSVIIIALVLLGGFTSKPTPHVETGEMKIIGHAAVVKFKHAFKKPPRCSMTDVSHSKVDLYILPLPSFARVVVLEDGRNGDKIVFRCVEKQKE